MKHRKVGNVMTSDVVRVQYATPFKEVAALLAEHQVSGLPVVDDDERVIGVVSATDLLVRQADQDRDPPRRRLRLTRAARTWTAKSRAGVAGELMSTPPVTIHADDTIVHSARAMAEHRVERLPVLDEENRLVGIVTRRDLLKVFLRPDADIRSEVIDEVLVRTLWQPPHTVAVTVTAGVVRLDGLLERASEVTIAVRMTAQIDGVVDVVDNLTARFDDSRVRPVPRPTAHGVATDLLHKP